MGPLARTTYQEAKYFPEGANIFIFSITHTHTHTPVSYTHLDVYKRQGLSLAFIPDVEWF